MRYNIKDMSIWKGDPGKRDTKNTDQDPDSDGFRKISIEDLNLSMRSFNSLKRAECNTVGDILDAMDEESGGLRRFRNLGVRSEQEIREKVERARAEYRPPAAARPRTDAGRTSKGLGEWVTETPGAGERTKERSVTRVVLRPSRNLWDMDIGDFHLSHYAEERLRNCGVSHVGDLYATHPKQEPGWYAVRELFRKIAEYG